MESSNKTILISRPSDEQVMLVIGLILDSREIDLESTLSGMIPEMAQGSVPAGLLIVGDSVLVVRNQKDEITVDEVSTEVLLALADIDDPWSRDTLVPMMQTWISTMSRDWRDRVVGEVKELLVPHVVAGLGGDVSVHDGIWGMDGHRVASAE